MKKKSIILYLMTGLVFLSSCDDNLELENPNQKTTSS